MPSVDPVRLGELIKRVRAAKGPERELDARLMCLGRGWRFVRLATDKDFTNAYRDEEPGPIGHSKVLPGSLIFYNPTPGRNEHHWQQWASQFTPYTASLDAALALVKRTLPHWKVGTADADPTRGGLNRRAWAKVEPFLGNDEGWKIGAHEGFGATVPLAILGALLAALAKSETDGGAHV